MEHLYSQAIETCNNLHERTFTEISYSQKVTYHMILCVKHHWNDKIIEIGNSLAVSPWLSVGWGGWNVSVVRGQHDGPLVMGCPVSWTSWQSCCTIVLHEVCHWRKLCKGFRASHYYFFQLHVYIQLPQNKKLNLSVFPESFSHCPVPLLFCIAQLLKTIFTSPLLNPLHPRLYPLSLMKNNLAKVIGKLSTLSLSGVLSILQCKHLSFWSHNSQALWFFFSFSFADSFPSSQPLSR